jgi:hypothetical protein
MDLIEGHKDAPVDYSPAFSARVSQLGDSLSTRLNVTVGYQRDMNYAAGQQIVIFLDRDLSVTSTEAEASYSLRVCVSSKGPLWALLLCARKGSQTWEFIDISAILGSPDATGGIAGIRDVMDAAGLTEIPHDSLEHLVPGKETDLDGAPATVRDVFFCEIC